MVSYVMDVIWAPWRIEYIKREKEKECILCRGAREEQDRESLILLRGTSSFIIMNRYPYSNGHLMVVPYRHVSELEELSHVENLELMNLITKSVEILRADLTPDGFNIGMNIGRVAGAGIDDHLHFHVVPRWSGDTNFMPVIADVKVMPEYLDETYGKLVKRFKSERKGD